METTIKVSGNKEGGLILTISGMTKLGPDEIEIFPWRDGCHILSNLSNDLLLLEL